MIPDGLQYFLEHFWDDQQCDQICTLGPRIYHKITSKIQEIMGALLNIFFMSDNVEGMYTQRFNNLEFVFLKIYTFESVKF